MSRSLRKAVLLAAGRGRRLSPYTDQIPKPMLPLAGPPLIEYLLHHLGAAGIEQALLIVGHLGHCIEEHFGARACGLDLHYQTQTVQRGNGAATLLARPFIGADPFVLAWGDVLFARGDVTRLVAAYPETNPPDGLLALEWVDDPHQGAAVYLDDQRITQIVEKPPPGSAATHWNQAGLAVYSPRIFTYLEQLAPSPRGELEFTGAVQGLVEGGHRVQGLPLTAPRLHVTRPEDIAPTEQVLRTDPRYGI